MSMLFDLTATKIADLKNKVCQQLVKIGILKLILLLSFLTVIVVISIYKPIIAVIVFCLCVFLMIVVHTPSICLFLILFTAPILNIGIMIDNPVRFRPEFISLSAGAIFFAIVMAFLQKTIFSQNQERYWKFDSAVNLLFGLFFVYGLTGLLWTADFYHGVEEIILILLSFSLLKVFPGLANSKKTVQLLLKSVPILSIVLIGQVILSEMDPGMFKYNLELTKGVSLITSLHVIGSGNKIRPAGFAPVNYAANILAVLVFIHVILIYQSRWVSKIVNAFIILSLLYAILKTGSKAAVGALIIGIFCLPVIVPELRKKIIRISFFAFILISFFVVFAGELLLKRIEAVYAGKGEGGFLSQRMEWWTTGLNNLIDTLGFGAGTGGFSKLVDPVPGAHSMYFSVIFDYGLIGSILFFSFLGILIYRISIQLQNISDRNLKFSAYCLFGSLVPIFIHGLVDMEFTYVMLWLILAFILMIIKVSHEEQCKIL